jgi:hypothetical protein
VKAPVQGAGLQSSAWDLPRVAVDSFGACMIVTMLLDFWRLTVGGVDGGTSAGFALF